MEAKVTFDVTRSISPKGTKEIAQKLAQSLKGGEILALFGDLGAGKTVFVKGLAKGLKVDKPVTSPTFVFMKMYTAHASGKVITFYHLDLYRTDNNLDLQSLGIDEIFDKNSIVAIEWAAKLGKFLPKERINITIKLADEKTRNITIDRRV